ncbi:MAG: peptide chain release factor N(5)-glutamine methyltransferase [Bernardetiaceae bacterium]
MTLRQLRDQIADALTAVYDPREARNIAQWLLEHRTGICPADFGWHELDHLPDISTDMDRLLHHEPIQYVLGSSHFAGLELSVSSAVLIPRPETEELVQSIIGYCRTHNWLPERVLDVGTGSGCIIVALAAAGCGREFWGWDMSSEALEVARRNAESHGQPIHWIEDDFLCPDPKHQQERFDLVVSNPPYIPDQEWHSLEAHVRDHEPALALRVPDTAPLLFYERLARWAVAGGLRQNGRLFAEIHPRYARALTEDWTTSGLDKVQVQTDLAGKKRFVQAVWTNKSKKFPA